MVVDDYGHHPAEIRATLAGARAGFTIAASSPRSSRIATRARATCMGEFARAFNEADMVVVCDIYAAGEEPIAGVTSARLVDEMRARATRGALHVAKRADVAVDAVAASCATATS